MKTFGALMLALSAATPASSVFVIVPDVISAAGTGALIAMALGAVIAFSVAHLYAELGSAFPLAGGEYVMVGKTLGPLAGFVVLGLNLFNSLLAAAVFALGAASYLGFGEHGAAPVSAAVAIVALSAGLGLLRVRASAGVTGLFVAVELLALAVLAGLGLAHAHNPLPELVLHPVMKAAGGGGSLVPAGFGAIALAATVALFAYDGYGSAVYFGEETHEAPRAVARAIVLALIITVVAELVPLAFVLAGAPDLKRLVASEGALSAFARQAGGPVLARSLSLGIGLAMANAVIATVLLTARQLWSAGRHRTWGDPLDGALARVDPARGSPWAATLVAGGLAAGLCLVPLKLLLIATGAGTAFVYASLCLAVLAGRRSGATAHGVHRAPLAWMLPAGTLVALAGVLAADFGDPAEGRPGLLIAAGVGFAFGLWRLTFLRHRSNWLAGSE